ncbi:MULTISPECIES: hypothetical protein [unclassified Rhodococcus (in: high G+C Gram-positive bacteria)]|uniref:hypothetical protein n=1 Tax=unclassified Rhodococcus (in: high G+C Gram-positive bacteria) TaxID=192944 RepID=UPI0015C4C1E9|nr:hypothetical protein [Rhodococcus sp. 1163]
MAPSATTTPPNSAGAAARAYVETADSDNVDVPGWIRDVAAGGKVPPPHQH